MPNLIAVGENRRFRYSDAQLIHAIMKLHEDM